MELQTCNSYDGWYDGIPEKGIYPNKLRITSVKYDHVWRIKVTDEIQSGVLKINQVPVYNYIFDEAGFRMQEMVDGVAGADWLHPYMQVIMQD